MKKIILFVVALLILSVDVSAQNNIQLQINHKLGTQNFALDMASTNNIANDFKYTRFQYYISEISIVHDGGMETAITDLWVLVNATELTQVDLGSYDINAVESIKFHVGVDPASNHEDPSSFPNTHPLAPKNPSMHWGWTAGYRFMAIEGNGGADYNQLFQLHGLGDGNYFQTSIEIGATAVDNAITINLDADYNRALENIGVNSGVLVHGEDGAARTSLQNFRDYVFSPAAAILGVEDFDAVNAINLFPNPTTSKASILVIESTDNATYDIVVTDILGRKIQNHFAINSNTQLPLSFDNAGLYFVTIMKDGQLVSTEKLMVN